MKLSDVMLLSLVVLAGCREWERRPGTAADSLVSGTADQTTTSPRTGDPQGRGKYSLQRRSTSRTISGSISSGSG